MAMIGRIMTLTRLFSASQAAPTKYKFLAKMPSFVFRSFPGPSSGGSFSSFSSNLHSSVSSWNG